MRRFPFLVAPLLGIVALFFLVKLLFAAILGLAVFGLALGALRAVAARRFHHAYQMGAAYQRHTPLGGMYREPGFPYATSQQRIVEII